MVQPAEKRLVTEAALPEAVRSVLESSFVAGVGITITHDGGANTVTISTSGLDTEAVQDAVAAMILESFNISVVYDDTAGTYTISTSALNLEEVQDAVAAMLVEATGLSAVYDDTEGTYTLTLHQTLLDIVATASSGGRQFLTRSSTGSGGAFILRSIAQTKTDLSLVSADISDLIEVLQDAVAAMLVEGTGLSAVYDDGAGTYTISSTITQYTDEMARDSVGAAITAGAGISKTVDDGADTITLATPIPVVNRTAAYLAANPTLPDVTPGANGTLVVILT